jgi:tyrosyl-tRNA synthetase
VSRFLRLYTLLPPAEIQKLEKLQDADVREAKKVLAREVTTLVHGADEAAAAEKAAMALFSGGGDDSTVPSSERPAADFTGAGLSLLDALIDTGLMKSKGEARRMIRQKAVKVAGDLVDDETLMLTERHIQNGKITLQIGKKRHHHIQVIP